MIKDFFSWKVKIIFLGIIINALLMFYIYFHQNPQNEYYKKKIEEIEQQVSNDKIFKEALQRYKNFLDDKKLQKILGKEKITDFDEKMTKKFEDLKLTFKKEALPKVDYYDFYFWKEKVTFETKYKTLRKVLDFSGKQDWQISTITIVNKENRKKDPLLQVTIIFVFIIEKL